MPRLSRAALGAAFTLIIAVTAGCGTPAASPASQPPGSGQAVSQPAGGPVPPGFAATSVTLVSTQEAFVLGAAPCAHAPCASIVRTLDRGATWRGLPAPVVPIGHPGGSNGSSATPHAWGIRFATPRHGFVFGYGLWETTDGTGHWTQVPSPGGAILSLAIVDGQVLALTTPAPPQAYGYGEVNATLARRPLGGGFWQLVTVVHAPWYLDPTDMVSTQAGIATVVDGTSVLVTTDGGRTFTRHATPCARPGTAAAALAAPTARGGLVLVCVGQGYMGHMVKSAFTSADLGAHWIQGGTPPSAGAPYALAAGTPSDVVLSTSTYGSWLVRSTNDAATWKTVTTTDDGGGGWADLGFTTPSDGAVIHGPVLSDGNSERLPGQLFLTSDAGSTWYQVRF